MLFILSLIAQCSCTLFRKAKEICSAVLSCGYSNYSVFSIDYQKYTIPDVINKYV